ncbi:uncharacterized protein LOC114863209 [Betta splendens]|uniref:Uncharacterized protein LOC114863209 n=1 Tax=Betta splendens TaxID=158456 RepID=A0A6P7NPK1_BETSP|nr:uncharacterized protein LOC114863209 [Betta splendens]
MRSVGSPLVQAAAETTALPPSIIENCIGNFKRTLQGPSKVRPMKNKLYKRNLSPYNLFCRDHLQNKGTLKDIKQKWPMLGEEKKRQYYEEAAALRAEATVKNLSPEMRELKIKKHLKSLKLEVSSLEELGVETIVLSFDHQKATMEVSEVSSKGASESLASTDTVNNFALHFKEDVGGVGKIPYQSLRNHNVTIHAAGLPKGLTLKKPSFYGRKQLEDIIKAEDQISFHIGGENGAQSQTVEEILDAMCGNGGHCTQEPGEMSSSVAVVTVAEDAARRDSFGLDICSVCHAHFEDKRRNALKKWRQWRQCSS